MAATAWSHPGWLPAPVGASSPPHSLTAPTKQGQPLCSAQSWHAISNCPFDPPFQNGKQVRCPLRQGLHLCLVPYPLTICFLLPSSLSYISPFTSATLLQFLPHLLSRGLSLSRGETYWLSTSGKHTEHPLHPALLLSHSNFTVSNICHP